MWLCTSIIKLDYFGYLGSFVIGIQFLIRSGYSSLVRWIVCAYFLRFLGCTLILLLCNSLLCSSFLVQYNPSIFYFHFLCFWIQNKCILFSFYRLFSGFTLIALGTTCLLLMWPSINQWIIMNLWSYWLSCVCVYL